jgi:VWFA-related protein
LYVESVRPFVFLVLAGALAGLEGLELHTPALQPLPTFRSSVEVVPISAVVRDRQGRLVTTLAQKDFEIFDNGERRAIIDFHVDRLSPVTLAVLVDMSGSMKVGPKVEVARRALGRLAAEVRQGDDEIGVFTFDATIQEQQPFTTYPPTLDGVLKGAQPFGTTSLYDAIADAAERLDDRPSMRRGVIVLTDGVDTSSTLSAPEVSGLASAIDVPVYVLVTAPEVDRPAPRNSTSSRAPRTSADLQDLALWTGGDFLWASTGEDAERHSEQIMFELRHRYLIAIESSGEGGWRPIAVRVRDLSMTVRARSGYSRDDHRLK